MAGPLTLRGLFVPVVTPFDTDGAVDVKALEGLATGCLAAGATGIVALATTGEASSLDDGERRAAIDACARACAAHGAPLIVGAGTNDTRTTIARHRALAEAGGVAASLAVVPYYVRPSEAAIVAHFKAVAAASPVPVVLYNVPYRTGRGLGAEAMLELAATDNIVGVKQAVGSVDADTLTVLAHRPAGFSVLCGDDPFLLPLTLMGATGAIAASAQVCTDRFAAMIEAGLDGRVDEGRKLAEALLPLSLALFAEPSPAVIKGVLHREGRIPTPHVRMPLADASAEAVEAALRARP
ncbi:MAG TPA: 4-hydroxy-tetrahydrodipicolinate synthase [Acidimicrobiales bacterium]|nr:4-hydroxy-tetrahydrodipicolinate synthase [Acidimicrobiales bacterium]